MQNMIRGQTQPHYDELIDLLITISVIAKRLATKLTNEKDKE